MDSEGGKLDVNDPVLTMWREYRLAKLFGWTPAQMADVPGEWIDWALEIAQQNNHG